MLTITLPATDLVQAAEVNLEHSLLSLSKWEARSEKPFFKDEKTPEETLDYIEDMVLGVPPEKFRARLTPEHIQTIGDYINSKQTATWFAEDNSPNKPSQETTTAELIYFWMLQFKIPFSCEEWHVNKLMTLIRVCSVKSQPPKKMSPASAKEEMQRLNAIRKKQLGTNG